jgi:hypothetical protein
MDNYPEQLAPIGNGTFEKEPFQVWWGRVSEHFPTVPKNVARQWIWRHWHESDFCWLPTMGSRFELARWQPEEIEVVKIWREGSNKYEDWEDHLLSLATQPRNLRYGVAEIMFRRKRWPAPPIVLDNRNSIGFAPWKDLSVGFVLVEGNRRMAMAKALARRNQLARDLSVWVLKYDDTEFIDC